MYFEITKYLLKYPLKWEIELSEIYYQNNLAVSKQSDKLFEIFKCFIFHLCVMNLPYPKIIFTMKKILNIYRIFNEGTSVWQLHSFHSILHSFVSLFLNKRGFVLVKPRKFTSLSKIWNYISDWVFIKLLQLKMIIKNLIEILWKAFSLYF